MNRNCLAAAAVGTILLAACSSNDPDSAVPPSSTPTATSSSDGPIDLAQLPGDTSLEPGKYLVPFLYDDSAKRAVVDLPPGYSGGGPVFGTDDGDVAFWGKVTRVATDACHGGSRPVGPSVRDLATALAHQGHMTHTPPVPVRIGGYRGLYIKTTAPRNLDPCRGNSVFVYTAGGTWLQSDVPRATFRAWILNVGGQRVVAGTRSFTDTADSDPINRIFATTEFTSVDEP